MPQVVIGAAVAGAVSAATALPWLAGAAFLKSFATSLVLGGLSHALAPKPKRPSSIKAVDSNTFAIRQSDEPRKHIYGITRVADVFAHMVKTGDNEKLHAFLVLSDDELTKISEIWVDDYSIPADWISADGTVNTGRYKDKLRIRRHYGEPNQIADAVAVSEISDWTENDRGRGVSYLYLTLTKNKDVYPTGFPNFSAICWGPEINDPRGGQKKFSTNGALVYSDYLAHATFGFSSLGIVSGTEPATEANVSSEANICDEIVDTSAVDMTVGLNADTELTTSAIDTATNIIALQGDRLLFEIGDRVRLVTDGTPPAGLATATDYYVIPYQIKDNPRIQLASSLDDAMASIAIDITDAGSGTFIIRKTGEPRYHVSGIINTADEMGDIMNAMLNSMAGRAVIAGGVWQLFTGVWRTPTIDLDIHDLRGPINFDVSIPFTEAFNVISGKHISSLNNYQSSDYPVVKYQADIDSDGGEYPPRTLNLTLTPRPSACKRIAKIEYLRSRQDIVWNAPFDMKAFQLQAGSTTSMTFPADGSMWDAKYFEVTQFSFIPGLAENNPALLCRLTLRETSEEMYEWADTEFQGGDPAPNSNLPDPFYVSAPTGLAFSSRQIDTSGGDAVYTLILSWNAHQDSFVNEGGQFEIQYKLTSDDDSAFVGLAPVRGDLSQAEVIVSSVNVSYDIRIRAINALGRKSSFSRIDNAVVGSSGGVGTTNDWGSVADAVGTSNDWGSVADAVGTTNDWGSVA